MRFLAKASSRAVSDRDPEARLRIASGAVRLHPDRFENSRSPASPRTARWSIGTGASGTGSTATGSGVGALVRTGSGASRTNRATAGSPRDRAARARSGVVPRRAARSSAVGSPDLIFSATGLRGSATSLKASSAASRVGPCSACWTFSAAAAKSAATRSAIASNPEARIFASSAARSAGISAPFSTALSRGPRACMAEKIPNTAACDRACLTALLSRPWAARNTSPARPYPVSTFHALSRTASLNAWAEASTACCSPIPTSVLPAAWRAKLPVVTNFCKDPRTATVAMPIAYAGTMLALSSHWPPFCAARLPASARYMDGIRGVVAATRPA